jgi:hypothetical protein
VVATAAASTSASSASSSALSSSSSAPARARPLYRTLGKRLQDYCFELSNEEEQTMLETALCEPFDILDMVREEVALRDAELDEDSDFHEMPLDDGEIELDDDVLFRDMRAVLYELKLAKKALAEKIAERLVRGAAQRFKRARRAEARAIVVSTSDTDVFSTDSDGTVNDGTVNDGTVNDDTA